MASSSLQSCVASVRARCAKWARAASTETASRFRCKRAFAVSIPSQSSFCIAFKMAYVLSADELAQDVAPRSTRIVICKQLRQHHGLRVHRVVAKRRRHQSTALSRICWRAQNRRRGTSGNWIGVTRWTPRTRAPVVGARLKSVHAILFRWYVCTIATDSLALSVSNALKKQRVRRLFAVSIATRF